MTPKPRTRKAPAKRASNHVCTEKEAAAINFEPWNKDDVTVQIPTPEEINNPHLVSCRLAYSLMFKSKPEIIEMFKRAEEMDAEKTLNLMFDNLRDTQKFFTGMVTLLDAATSRLIVAGSSYYRERA
ncbi:MAG TPA: hypothetical protein VIE66_04330 [Methylocella sp.]|jgi:hypothetical protein